MNTRTAKPQRVALYARISQDATGQALGVADQLDRARTFAQGRDYQVVAEQWDNSISAFKGVDRPGYQKVLDLARRHQIDRVIVFHLTRLTRNRREWAEIIDDFHAHGVSVSEAQGIDYDLSTAAGRSMVAMQSVWTTMESEVKSERVTAAAARRARAGQPSGSLGYGWEKVGTGAGATYTEHPHEAKVVRSIVDRLLAGESLRGVTESLNRRGEPAPNSATWGKTAVKKLALRDSNIAVRVHHRGRPDEERFDGCWPPLVDRAKHAKVVALLVDPVRQSNGTTRPGARKHLLSWGIGECGVCGSKLRHSTKRGRYGKPQALYICDSRAACVGRNEAAVDELVAEVVFERLSRSDALDWLVGDDEEARQLTERVAEIRRRLDGAADDYADGLIDREQLRRITAKLTPELDEAQEGQRAAVVTLDLDVMAPLAGPQARERWAAMALTQRRAVLDTLGIRVVINKATHRGPGFDPKSVDVVWKS
ncbi:recombinase family protein [Gordonia sp. NPDC057258]|uniref:recombinase family protein n=1 Tax=unclassified Gordonia (in: high G+C Gram-positive bacteria) TaxID=2657482 RepID=UPI00362D0377